MDFKDNTWELKKLGLVSVSPLMLIYFSLPNSGSSVEKFESSWVSWIKLGAAKAD